MIDEYHRITYIDNAGNYWAHKEDVLTIVVHDGVWLEWEDFLCSEDDYFIRNTFRKLNGQVIKTDPPEVKA